MTAILEVYEIATGRVRHILSTDRLIEAPNWYPDGSGLLVNAEGRLWRVPFGAPELIEVPTGAAIKCNNDHAISPDGTQIALSSHHGQKGSEIYLVPLAGGDPVLVSLAPPSWFHGWSPDGKWLTYPATRDATRVLDIYKLNLATGRETRLTQGQGHHDGSDFSADGSAIYYNCDRDGHAQIWVMNADGSDQRKLFADEQVNWFPHPSPCGRYLIYLAYPPGTEGHPRDLAVALVLCNLDGSDRKRIREFTGGQGTMNVPNWAPDGSAFAYVRYAPASENPQNS
jgi:Tol biopolymer transport system component